MTNFSINFLTEFIENYYNTSYKKNASSQLEFLNLLFIDKKDNALLNNIRYTFMNLNQTTKERLGLTFDEMILDCKFSDSECKKEDFKWIYHFKYGSCFIFNHDKRLSNRQAGKSNGLTLELFSGIEDSMPFVKSTGFTLFVYNQSESVEFFYYFEKLFLKPNTDHVIAIRPYIVNKLKKPYSACEVSSMSDIKAMKFSEHFTNYTYRRIFCFQLIFRKRIHSECDCVIELNDVPGVNKTCISPNQTTCVARVYNKEFLTNRFDGQFDKICPIECNYMFYTYMMSSHSFPTTYYTTHLKGLYRHMANFSVRDIKKSVAHVHIYFKRLSYARLTEIPTMTILDLIAGTGGMLGLFLGMSFLSFVEIFEFIAEIAMLVTKSIRTKRVKRVHSNNVSKTSRGFKVPVKY